MLQYQSRFIYFCNANCYMNCESHSPGTTIQKTNANFSEEKKVVKSYNKKKK